VVRISNIDVTSNMASNKIKGRELSSRAQRKGTHQLRIVMSECCCAACCDCMDTDGRGKKRAKIAKKVIAARESYIGDTKIFPSCTKE